jgi:hypothetical protein
MNSNLSHTVRNVRYTVFHEIFHIKKLFSRTCELTSTEKEYFLTWILKTLKSLALKLLRRLQCSKVWLNINMSKCRTVTGLNVSDSNESYSSAPLSTQIPEASVHARRSICKLPSALNAHCLRLAESLREIVFFILESFIVLNVKETLSCAIIHRVAAPSLVC